MEKEYIEKGYVNYLLDYFGSMLTWSKEDIISEIKEHIEKAKTNRSSINIIKCKHCKHFREGMCFHNQWWNDDFCVSVNADDFCSFAEPIK